LTVDAGVATISVTGSGFPGGSYFIAELYTSDGSTQILARNSGDTTASLGGVFSTVVGSPTALSAGVYSVVVTSAAAAGNVSASAPLVVK
jgi:hypothetical protein